MKQLQLLQLGKSERVVSTRDRGRAAADRIQEALDKGSLVISFDGVEIATPSYLDEIVRRLGGLLRGNETRVVVIAGANEEVAETLDLVLGKHKMSLAAMQDKQVKLLGGSAQLRKTLKAAQKLGSFGAAELAEELELKLPNLHQRLKDLMEAGAVARELDSTASHGKRHRYDAPDARVLEAVC
jgi:hypothetical protein